MKWGWLIAGGVVVWWLFFRKHETPAAHLAAEVATGSAIDIPEFGTDNILDAADAIAATANLPVQPSSLLPPTGPGRQSQF